MYTFDKRGELLMLLGRPDYSDADEDSRHTLRSNTWNLLGGFRLLMFVVG